MYGIIHAFQDEIPALAKAVVIAPWSPAHPNAVLPPFAGEEASERGAFLRPDIHAPTHMHTHTLTLWSASHVFFSFRAPSL